LYGISQNPVTNDYILVQNNSINLMNWMSGNEKIELKIEDHVFDWIPYNQFCDIKKTGKNSFMSTYSAIWKNRPIYYYNNAFRRDPNKKIALKCLHNLQNPVESLVNEV
jgi:hypothetical protein